MTTREINFYLTPTFNKYPLSLKQSTQIFDNKSCTNQATNLSVLYLQTKHVADVQTVTDPAGHRQV